MYPNFIENFLQLSIYSQEAVIAQLGERQTEDLKVPGSIPGRGMFFPNFIFLFLI